MKCEHCGQEMPEPKVWIDEDKWLVCADSECPESPRYLVSSAGTRPVCMLDGVMYNDALRAGVELEPVPGHTGRFRITAECARSHGVEVMDE